MADFYQDMRQIAEGRLICDCGNADWQQFIFVSGGSDTVIAGCKKCGHVYAYRNGQWERTV